METLYEVTFLGISPSMVDKGRRFLRQIIRADGVLALLNLRQQSCTAGSMRGKFSVTESYLDNLNLLTTNKYECEI